MVLNYVCTFKCFFRDRIFVPGDVVIMDTEEGDAHPWFVRDPDTAPAQEEMQTRAGAPTGTETKDTKTKAPAVKAGAKAVNGGKAK